MKIAKKYDHDFFKKVYKFYICLKKSSPTLKKIIIRIIYFELYVHFIHGKVDVEIENKYLPGDTPKSLHFLL